MILNFMLNVKCYTWLLYTENYFNFKTRAAFIYRAASVGLSARHSVSITRQRNGLVYHPEYDGFAPDSWQVVINAHESARLELAGLVDGAPSTIVNIQRSPALRTRRCHRWCFHA